MRYIGIDFGKKRIGLAISDENNRIAFPKEVIDFNHGTYELISNICKENNVKDIVVGESKDFNGDDNPIMKEVNIFITELKNRSLNVFLEPEFLSSHQAENMRGEKNKMTDASAATIILQSYLDRINKRDKKMTDEIKNEKQIIQEEIKKATYDEFKKIEIRIGKVLSAEKIPDTDKLLKLSVDFNEGKPRQIVSGIALHFTDPQEIVGKKFAFCTNLEPRKIKGFESNGMILGIGGGEGDPFSLLIPSNNDAKEGGLVK